MLVLTRKQAEMVQIGDKIIVKVIQTGRGSIKIGIEAPAEVRITRGEVIADVNRLDQERTNNQPPTARDNQRELLSREAV